MEKQIEGMMMKKVLVLIVVAAMGLSSAVFAVETTTIPAPTVTTIKAAPVKTTYHKKQHKAAPVRKVQTVKKHHKNTKAKRKVPEQKVQAAKEHAKKYNHQQPTRPAAQPVA